MRYAPKKLQTNTKAIDMKTIIITILLIILLVTSILSALLYFRINQQTNKQITTTDENGVWIYPSNNRVDAVKKLEIVSGILNSYTHVEDSIGFEIQKINVDETFEKEIYNFSVDIEEDFLTVEIWNFEDTEPVDTIDYQISNLTDFIGYRVEIEIESEDLYSDFTKINRFIVYEV